MKHHPEYAWLEQYAAGALPISVALGISTHLSFCGDCRRQVDLLQSLGGLLIEQLAPIAVADELLAQIFTRIDSTAAHSDTATASTIAVPDNHADNIPHPLRKLVPNGYRQLRWSRLLPALRAANLDTGETEYSVALQRVAAGGKLPRHDHRGLEFTVVLRGSFSDEFGVYSDGDFMLREPGQRHLPLAAQNEECICLTVQQAPVRFTGWFWRCLNPLLR